MAVHSRTDGAQLLPRRDGGRQAYSASAAPRRWRLLIADDDPTVRTFLSGSLRGFDVISAADSEEAIELARSTSPDAALLDVQMPKGGGLRAVQGIVEASPDTAIIMLSVDESESSVRTLLAAGAISYCRKGTTPPELARLIAESIEAHTAARAGVGTSREPA